MITVLCAGTATDVGKTWVGAEVLGELRELGLKVAARKPVQSFAADDTSPTDAAVLGAATGEDVHTVCPEHRWYALAMAPPIAAALLEVDGFLVGELVDDIAPAPDDTDVLWVETGGGPRSPIADDGDSADVARWVQADVVVLVADAGLGTINAVRLSAIPFAGRSLIVVLNRYDEDDIVHRANLVWLAQDGFDVVTETATLTSRLLTAARP